MENAKMNRKTFLKSLLIIPAITLFGKEIFAKKIDSPTVELSDIRNRKFYAVQKYKLPFIDSKDKKIVRFDFSIFLFEDILSEKFSWMTSKTFEKIISLIGRDFYYINYWENNKDRHEKTIGNIIIDNGFIFETVIVGKELDWWTPVKWIEEKWMFVIDEDFISNKSYLTLEDREIIKYSILARAMVHPRKTQVEYIDGIEYINGKTRKEYNQWVIREDYMEKSNG
jgi:hypothetical protein